MVVNLHVMYIDFNVEHHRGQHQPSSKKPRTQVDIVSIFIFIFL